MKKNLTSYARLSRVSLESHFLSKAIHEPLGAYSPSNIFAWIKSVGKYWFTKKYPFPPLLPGIIRIEDTALFGIAGDWASGTDEAAAVAVEMIKEKPDYTIHLGDVYYVGNQQEVRENFLGLKSSQYDPLEWPKGTKGSFALSGNHEMYSNGVAYFTTLLTSLKQPTSFFRLENDNWVILGLDTGYNSTGIDFGPFKPSCALPDPVLTWLKVNPIPPNKGIIVLTHHQPWSVFDKSYTTPAKQLSQFLNRPIVWIWGHEHRTAVYDLHSESGITAYGICVGHGGMPVELKHPYNNNTSSVKVLFTDTRLYSNEEKLAVGYNGYASMYLSGINLHLNLVDLEGTKIYNFSTDRIRLTLGK